MQPGAANVLVVAKGELTVEDIELCLHSSGHALFAFARSMDEAIAAVQRRPHGHESTQSDFILPDLVLYGVGQAQALEARPVTTLARQLDVPVVYVARSAAELAHAQAAGTWSDADIACLLEPRELSLAIRFARHRHDSARLLARHGAYATEREQAEEALRASAAQLEAILQDQLELICRCSADGILTFVNEPYCRYFGMQREELVGKSFMPLIPEEDVVLVQEGFASLGPDNPVVMLEHRVILSSGEVRWHGWTNRAILDEAGQVVEYQSVGRDITERKHAEEQIKQLNVDLSRRAVELQAANAELESFSYSVSHDLRAPLRAMNGFSLVLMEDYAEVLDDRGRGYLHRLRRASQRMSRLIDDLLDLSRMSRSAMHIDECDLSGLARAVLQELRQSEPGRQVEVVIAPALRGWADRNLLRIALQNLLGNAWKFTSRRALARIELGAATHEGQTVYFVRDNGAGFDMAYVDKLFGAFQRLHGMDEFEGTGIGLATVQRIIRRHGGAIWAEGEVDVGATFSFTLS